MSYLIQVEQLERVALAEMALAPHLKEGAQLSTPEGAVTEFDKWLMQEPSAEIVRTADTELADLIHGR